MWDGGGGGCMSEAVDEGSVDSHRYFLGRRTLLEMLRDRGCAVADEQLALTLPAFRLVFTDNPSPDRLSITSYPIADPSNKVLVLFCGTEAVKLSVIRGIYNQVKDENLTRLILIFQSKVTSKAREATKEIFKFKVETFHILVLFCGTEAVKLSVIRGIYNQVKDENLTRLILVFQSKVTSKAREATKEIFKFKVETFHITELLVNITKHVLMPKQEILKEEEKKELLKKYSVKDSQIPRMLETDPFARYYGLERGQVVKVTYDGEVTGSHVTYRCVV